MAKGERKKFKNSRGYQTRINPVRGHARACAPKGPTGRATSNGVKYHIISLMKLWKIIFWTCIVVVIAIGILANIAKRASANPGTNIHPTPAERVAWSDVGGWWDFYISDTVQVKGTRLEGYAESAIGDMSLDCATTRNGNICGTSNYGICNGPGPHDPDGTCPNGNASGVLTGYAWNDTIGWISFNCNQEDHGGPNTCTETPGGYGVTINTLTGDFEGYAWNDIEGWISFNGSGYKVATDWRSESTLAFLESSVFDTEAAGGVLLNNIVWQGEQPGGTSVDFQVAVSNCPNGATNPPDCTTGTWIFEGPDGNPNLYYGAACSSIGTAFPGAGPNVPICIDRLRAENYRYLRYKVRLMSDLTETLSPVIEDIILNWSR